MKRKVIIALSIYAILFFCGGIYITHVIDRTTTKLDNLIMLHQVEILREHYLIQIRKVQTDLTLRGTKYARDLDTIVGNVTRMERVVETCFDCHHIPEVTARIADLRDHTYRYEEALSRVLTIRANEQRVTAERDTAFVTGEELIDKVSDMITMTGARLERSTQQALVEISRTKRLLLSLISAGPVISVALGFLLVRGLSKPLETLLTATRRLKAGDLDHRVQGLRAEFAELGNAFNDMSAALKDHIANRQRAERMAMLGQLAAGLAHEIKNPLAGIKAAMEVLSLEGNLAPEDSEVVLKVRKEIGRVETLMKSFLNFARPAKPQPANVDINALVSSSVTLYAREPRPGAPAPVQVISDLGPLPIITTDPMQLEQVLINLILNAFEAMPAGGTLTVRTRHDDGGMVEIAIGDTGKGIPEENLVKIFEPFFTTKPRGTGLGLAISRQLIEQQGGELKVTSRVGVGTEFAIRLPAVRVPVEALA